MKEFYSLESIKNHLRKSDTLISKLLLVPISVRTTFLIANYTNLKPATISLFGLILGIFSAYLFYIQEIYFAIIAYFFSINLDVVDGLVARLKKIESVRGIIFDTYIDFIVLIINIYALVLINLENEILVNLLTIYLIIHFLESWIDFGVFSVFKFYKKKEIIKLNVLDNYLFNLKIFFEKYNLRTIFFYYQERYFCIFIILPLLNFNFKFLIMVLVLTIFMINFKVIFDISMIKISLRNKINHSFKFRDNIGE